MAAHISVMRPHSFEITFSESDQSLIGWGFCHALWVFPMKHTVYQHHPRKLTVLTSHVEDFL